MTIKTALVGSLLTVAGFLPSASSAQVLSSRLLPADVTFPEGIAAGADGTVYVGSLVTGAVARFRPGASSADLFVPPGRLDRAAAGLAVDDARGLLWVCDGSPLEPSASALVGLSLADGRRRVTHDVPAAQAGDPVLCNDVSIDRRGNLFITESFSGRVYRVPRRRALRNTLAELWSTDATLQFGANGIVAGRRAVWAVNFNEGTLVRIRRNPNGTAGLATVVPLYDVHGQPTTLVGPDGLTAEEFGAFLVVENGLFSAGGGNRLSRIELRWQSGRLIGTVIPLATGLDIPSTVAVVGDTAWVAEGQFDHLFGFDPNPPAPFQIVGVPRP